MKIRTFTEIGSYTGFGLKPVNYAKFTGYMPIYSKGAIVHESGGGA